MNEGRHAASPGRTHPGSALGGEKRAANAPAGVCHREKDESEEEGTAPSLRRGVGAGEKALKLEGVAPAATAQCRVALAGCLELG